MTRKQHNRWIVFFLVVLTIFVALFYAGCSEARADSPTPDAVLPKPTTGPESLLPTPATSPIEYSPVSAVTVANAEAVTDADLWDTGDLWEVLLWALIIVMMLMMRRR